MKKKARTYQDLGNSSGSSREQVLDHAATGVGLQILSCVGHTAPHTLCLGLVVGEN